MANKVLIFTASYGEGHNAAARNLREALELVYPEVEVEVIDALERSYPRWNELARKTYLGLVRLYLACESSLDFDWLARAFVTQSFHRKLRQR